MRYASIGSPTALADRLSVQATDMGILNEEAERRDSDGARIAGKVGRPAIGVGAPARVEDPFLALAAARHPKIRWRSVKHAA